MKTCKSGSNHTACPKTSVSN